MSIRTPNKPTISIPNGLLQTCFFPSKKKNAHIEIFLMSFRFCCHCCLSIVFFGPFFYFSFLRFWCNSMVTSRLKWHRKACACLIGDGILCGLNKISFPSIGGVGYFSWYEAIKRMDDVGKVTCSHKPSNWW